jgi:glycosyltransferase involved in cell wall biosynthesis
MRLVERVSVIIPYYNRAQFIDECLSSVFAQTKPADEIIVVNDASDSAQRRHLDRYLPLIRIVDQARNGGVSSARNAGIRAATGDWIAFNDSDDAWVAHKLATQIEHVQRHSDCDGVHSAISVFREDGRVSVSQPIEARLTLEAALHDNMIRVQSLLIKSKVLREIGGFDESLRCCEDDDLSIRLAAAGYKIDFMPTPLTRMRRGNYDHLFGDWRRIIRGKALVAMRHRALLERQLGRGAARRRIARAIRKVGAIKGGAFGRLLFACGWLAGGFEKATD